MKYYVIISLFLCIVCSQIESKCFRFKKKDHIQNISVQPQKKVSMYQPKKFDIHDISFLSKKQKEEHYTLYEGYVKRLNEIHEKLNNAQRNPGNTTYTEYRGLKIAETFAWNGIILHELYFENCINGKGTIPDERLVNIITKTFPSFEAAIKDLRDCAACARGWALMCYSLIDNTIYNFVLDAHNETVPVMVIPLVVLDVYEHAYMIDFGINRSRYLDELLGAINWEIVSQRLKNVAKL